MKMKKGLLTMLALLSIGSSAFAQKTLDVPEVARKAGNVQQVVVLESEKKGTVKVLLSGTEDYRDLQFDIVLPDGVTAAEGQNVFSDNYAVQSAVQPDRKTVRFVLYSESAAKLSNEILFEIPVTIEDVNAVNGAKATIENVLSSNDAALTSLTDIQGSEFPFSVMKLGDINDNGEVEIGDATCVINNIVGEANDVYVAEVADVNNQEGPGEIGDATSIVNIIVGVSTPAKKNFNEQIGDTLDPE